MSAHAGLPPGASGEEDADSGRILSWEEYRAQYVRQQRQRYQLQREANANTENGAAVFSPTAAASPQERWEQEQARRQHLAQPHPQQPQQAEADINIWARIEFHHDDVITVVRILGRVFLATFLLFRTFSLYYFFLTLLIYMGWRAGQRALGAIRIERENGDAAGNLFRGMTHPEARRRHHRRQHVSLPWKVVYIFTRCITSFLLSLSPTYSVEQLESELQEDGIVGPHLHQD